MILTPRPSCFSHENIGKARSGLGVGLCALHVLPSYVKATIICPHPIKEGLANIRGIHVTDMICDNTHTHKNEEA